MWLVYRDCSELDCTGEGNSCLTPCTKRLSVLSSCQFICTDSWTKQDLCTHPLQERNPCLKTLTQNVNLESVLCNLHSRTYSFCMRTVIKISSYLLFIKWDFQSVFGLLDITAEPIWGDAGSRKCKAPSWAVEAVSLPQGMPSWGRALLEKHLTWRPWALIWKLFSAHLLASQQNNPPE